MYNTPILFLIFNRPDTTLLAFEQIKKQEPKYLFVAADGPRKGNISDVENCRQTREIIMNNIDWDCEVKTLFRDSNLGCGQSVSSAISWFFEQVNQGIILEDDIVPDKSFFTFCEILLKKYEDDERIMQISGLNIMSDHNPLGASYFFARFGAIWGWATWKRAWNYYDFTMSQWEYNSCKKLLLDTFPSQFREARENLFEEQYKQTIDTWDYQWSFARLLNSGLSIVPHTNIIKNIGCKEGGTHIANYHPWSNLKVTSLPDQLIHPSNVLVDSDYDNLFLSTIHKPGSAKKKPNILRRNFRRVKKLPKLIYSKIVE